MPRKKHSGLLPNKPQGNRSLNLHIRLTEYDAERLHAACAHVGQSVSTYVRWLIHEGAKHTLSGPSKADQLKALEAQLHSLMPPVEPLPPERPLPPDMRNMVITPAPAYWEPKAAPPDAPVPAAVATLMTALTPPIRPPEPQKVETPAFTIPLTAPQPVAPPVASGGEWWVYKPGPNDPRPMELPDDMDDWA